MLEDALDLMHSFEFTCIEQIHLRHLGRLVDEDGHHWGVLVAIDDEAHLMKTFAEIPVRKLWGVVCEPTAGELPQLLVMLK